MKNNKILIIFISCLVLGGCGSGSSAEKNESPEIDLSENHDLAAGLFEFVSNYELLTALSGARATQAQLEQNSSIGSFFSILQNSSINQITFSGVVDPLKEASIFNIYIYESAEGILGPLVSEFSITPHFKITSETDSIASFNYVKEGVFSLSEGDYYLVITSFDSNFQWIPEHESHLDKGYSGGVVKPLGDENWSTTEWGRNIRLAGECNNTCQKAHTEYIVGTDGDDEIIGDDGSNIIYSAAGSDFVFGGKGADSYIFRLNQGDLTIQETNEESESGDNLNDSLIFLDEIHPGMLILRRKDFDFEVSFYKREETILIKKMFLDSSYTVGNFEFSNAPSYSPKYKAFDGLESYGPDWLVGNESNDLINAQDGNDVLIGHGGDDRLYGEGHDDLLIGGLGADQLDGGDGYDTAAYYDSQVGIEINLDANVGAKFGTAAGDTFNSIEYVIGTSFDDDITGDRFNNRLYGELGNDTLSGGEGADELWGGEGDDIMIGGQGMDALYAGEGNDTVTDDLGSSVIFSGPGDDLITGGRNSQVIIPDEGLDQMAGGDDKDFYVFRGDFDQNTVIDGSTNHQSELDSIIFSEISFNELWFEKNGSELVISQLGTNNQVIVTGELVAIYSDKSNAFLSAFLTPRNGGNFDWYTSVQLHLVKGIKLNDLIEVMENYSKPFLVDDLPQAVVDAQNQTWVSSTLDVL